MIKPISILYITLCLKYSAAELRFIVLGDWGVGIDSQKDVAAGMADYTVDNDPKFILTTGDNIYPEGILTVDDVQMQE